jgi:hypothetical protein
LHAAVAFVVVRSRSFAPCFSLSFVLRLRAKLKDWGGMLECSRPSALVPLQLGALHVDTCRLAGKTLDLASHAAVLSGQLQIFFSMTPLSKPPPIRTRSGTPPNHACPLSTLDPLLSQQSRMPVTGGDSHAAAASQAHSPPLLLVALALPEHCPPDDNNEQQELLCNMLTFLVNASHDCDVACAVLTAPRPLHCIVKLLISVLDTFERCLLPEATCDEPSATFASGLLCLLVNVTERNPGAAERIAFMAPAILPAGMPAAGNADGKQHSRDLPHSEMGPVAQQEKYSSTDGAERAVLAHVQGNNSCTEIEWQEMTTQDGRVAACHGGMQCTSLETSLATGLGSFFAIGPVGTAGDVFLDGGKAERADATSIGPGTYSTLRNVGGCRGKALPAALRRELSVQKRACLMDMGTSEDALADRPVNGASAGTAVPLRVHGSRLVRAAAAVGAHPTTTKQKWLPGSSCFGQRTIGHGHQCSMLHMLCGAVDAIGSAVAHSSGSTSGAGPGQQAYDKKADILARVHSVACILVGCILMHSGAAERHLGSKLTLLQLKSSVRVAVNRQVDGTASSDVQKALLKWAATIGGPCGVLSQVRKLRGVHLHCIVMAQIVYRLAQRREAQLSRNPELHLSELSDRALHLCAPASHVVEQY